MGGIKKDVQNLTEYLQDYIAGREPEKPVMSTPAVNKLASEIAILIESSGRMKWIERFFSRNVRA